MLFRYFSMTTPDNSYILELIYFLKKEKVANIKIKTTFKTSCKNIKYVFRHKK